MARARKIRGVKSGGNVRANARLIVATRTDEFFAFVPSLLNPADVTGLHAMRIAAKRLRYALEIFADDLGPDTVAPLATVKEFQETVGDIHDADVRVGLLRDYLHTRAAAQADAIADLAIGSADDESVDDLKTRAHATLAEMAAEQVALAAAITRATRERRAGYAQLRAEWDGWAETLRAQLDAVAGKAVTLVGE